MSERDISDHKTFQDLMMTQQSVHHNMTIQETVMSQQDVCIEEKVHENGKVMGSNPQSSWELI